jgi:signal transduction histidine kinase
MSANEKVNVLMVDDQPAKLLSYEAILGELGENLIKANSGREALEHLLKTDVAVVLMDVSMPELDGFELADMIREHPRFRHTAIIFVSAVHLTDLDRLKGYQRGAVDYLSVPVVPELLRAKVSVFAELHRRARQLEGLNDELRRLSGRLMTLQDEERRRIARELHDSIGQELVAAKMFVDGLLETKSTPPDQPANEASRILERAIQQVRSMSHLLYPPMLDEVGLLSALQWYVDGLTKRSGIETTLEVQPATFPRLAPELETAIFRIIQEALTNVFRHSGAHQAWVTLIQREGNITVRVRDDGRGIEEEIALLRPGSIGMGLGGLRQRTQEFRGELRISNLNPGTQVEVLIPSGEAASTARNPSPPALSSAAPVKLDRIGV